MLGALVGAIALAATLAGAPLGAQPPVPGVDAALDAARAERGRTLEVSVLTFANGEVLWERFGHNALVITDLNTGRSLAYNWGVFDFDSPDFLSRFLTGETRYWLDVYATDDMLRVYVGQDRSARMQVLALSDVQKAALADYVMWNAREEARYYRYDYYRENCSTPRARCPRPCAGRTPEAATPRTWRWPYLARRDGASAGVDAADVRRHRDRTRTSRR